MVWHVTVLTATAVANQIQAVPINQYHCGNPPVFVDNSVNVEIYFIPHDK